MLGHVEERERDSGTRDGAVQLEVTAYCGGQARRSCQQCVDAVEEDAVVDHKKKELLVVVVELRLKDQKLKIN